MRVAITGGIGEGKSTVLSMIRELGFRVASSDEVARQVWAESETQEALAIALGLPAVPPRDELRSLIATSPAARRAVNRVMHPRVVTAIDTEGAPFVEVPLLFEACRQGSFDCVWIVTCGEDEQHRRLLERYGSPEHVQHILRTQLPTPAKLPFADEIIRTNGDIQSVKGVVSRLVANLTQLGLRP